MSSWPDRPWRLLRQVLAIVCGSFVLVLAGPGPAWAHAGLRSSTPADGASLAQAPSQATLTFDEKVVPALRRAQVLAAGGDVLPGATVAAERGDGRQLVVSLPSLPTGTYAVSWQVVSQDDGHQSRGLLVFAVGDSTGVAPAAWSTGSADTGLDLPGLVVHWLGLALLAGTLGTLALAGLVIRAPRGHPSTAAWQVRRRLVAASAAWAGLATAVALLELPAERSALSGPPVSVLLSTRWGHLWLAHLCLLLALAAALLVVLRTSLRGGQFRPRGLVTVLALVASLALVEALRSHAAALPAQAAPAVLADAVHILAALTWLGAVPALAVLMAPRAGRLAGLGQGRFTLLAVGCVLATAVTGLYSAGRELATPSELFSSAYGRTLLVKLAIFVGIAGLGLLNWTRLRARAASASVRRTVFSEAVVGAVLLFAAVALAGTGPPPESPVPTPVAAPRTVSAFADDLVVTVTVRPARPGPAAISALVGSTRRPPSHTVTGVTVRLGSDGGSVDVPLRRVADDRFAATATLPTQPSLGLAAEVLRDGAATTSFPFGAVAMDRPRSPNQLPRLAPLTDSVAAVLVLAGAVAGVALLAARRRRARTDTAPLLPGPARPVELADPVPSR